jgi:putative flippase GtrA
MGLISGLLSRDFGRYFRFTVGGGLGLIVNLFVTYFCTEVLRTDFKLSYAIGLSVNLIFNFYYHAFVTFKKSGDKARLIKFIPLTLGITATNYILVLIFTELIILSWVLTPIGVEHYYRYAVIMGVAGFISIINYISNKLWIFR